MRIFVPGLPIAQPRPRACIRGAHASVYSAPAKHAVNAYKAAVALTVSQAWTFGLVSGPVSLSLVFLFDRVKRIIWATKPMPRQPHVSKPDADNLGKSAVDSLKGIIFHDDSQVYRLTIEKWYAAGDEKPGTWIEVG